MIILDRYAEFAKLYDRLMANDFDYEKWYEYLEEIFERYKKPSSILEMACGTGSLSYYLAKAGYDITAFDLSEEMLSIAYNKLIDFDKINLLHLDMRDFTINKKFDIILATCDSINYIIESRDLLDTFKNVYRHLDDNGIFIFDINSYHKLKNIIGNNTFVEDQEDLFYVWQNYYDEKKNLGEFYLTFFYKEEDNKFNRFEEVHMERAYKVIEIENLLKEAGFKNIEYYEAFTFKSVDEETERINFIAY